MARKMAPNIASKNGLKIQISCKILKVFQAIFRAIFRAKIYVNWIDPLSCLSMVQTDFFYKFSEAVQTRSYQEELVPVWQ